MSTATNTAKQVTDLTNISWSFGTTSTLCSRHSTPLSLLGSLGSPLSLLGSHSPPRTLKLPSQNRFLHGMSPFVGKFRKKILLRKAACAHHVPQAGQVPMLPTCPSVMGRVLSHNSSSIKRTHVVPTLCHRYSGFPVLWGNLTHALGPQN